MSRFLEALRSGRVLLMDGAMGTELIRQGLQPGENSATWNILHPERVRAVHQAYVDAGAEVLLTNTFQSNPFALAEQGFEQQLESINQNAVALARSVAGPDRFVLGDVGPLMALADEANRTFESLSGMMAQIVRSLRGADAILCETWYDGSLLVNTSLERTAIVFYGMPVLISFTYSRGPIQEVPPDTRDGWAPEHLNWLLMGQTTGWTALGINCGQNISIADCATILRRYRDNTKIPLFARPNAGTPVKDGDQWRYPHTPTIMAERLPQLLEAGVSMVGGCCGTTPEHIAAFRPIVDAWNAR